ncbi:MAG: hypothetical protein M9953_02865 [Thermomicrobiales bacterium]|nr:hypothetical protein [Thermomicrobiales bacterium]MCO5224257.1 hypothetical protein [Thermomicrobiales bacterium]
MDKKRFVKETAEIFDDLLETLDEQYEYLMDLGYEDDPLCLAIEWLLPQGEALLKRAIRGDTKVVDDDKTIGLMAMLEVVIEVAKAELQESEEDEPMDHPSIATHRVQ